MDTSYTPAVDWSIFYTIYEHGKMQAQKAFTGHVPDSLRLLWRPYYLWIIIILLGIFILQFIYTKFIR